MADLSLLSPSGRRKKGRRLPGGMPSTFYANRGGRLVQIGPDEEPVTIYSREWPYGRVYLPGGGRAIAPYGRSYPLPEALTELRLARGGRSPAYVLRRLGNPNGDLKMWLANNWRFIAIAVGVIVVAGAFLKK